MKKLHHSLLLILLITTFVTLYVLLRLPETDKLMCNALLNRSARLGLTQKSFFEGNENTQQMVRDRLISIINQKSGAVITGLSDKNGTLLLTEKNDSMVDTETYRAIAETIRDRKNTDPYMFRQSPWLRYYITWQEYENSRISIVYPFAYSPRIRMQFAIELVAMIACISLIYLFIIVRLSSSKRKNEIRSCNSAEIITTEIPDSFLTEAEIKAVSASAAPARDRENPPSIIDINDAPENDEREYSNADSSIYSIFHTIMHRHRIDGISLYQLESRTHSLRKTYELAGQSFVKIPVENSFIAETQLELIGALEAGSVVVLEKNRRILLPVFFEGLFLGALSLTNSGAIDGYTYQIIQKQCDGIGRALMKTMLSPAHLIKADTSGRVFK